jgi:hypothetical protein
MKKLFLDDIRWPAEAFLYTKQKIFSEDGWDIVRNYQEFVSHIEENGVPDFVSFDHDLAPEHYVDGAESIECTGYHCALWLASYCMHNSIDIPKYYIHSMNPVGKERIENIMRKAILGKMMEDNQKIGLYEDQENKEEGKDK